MESNQQQRNSASGGAQGLIRVGVIGALGRMGRETSRAVTDDADLELVAALDRVTQDSDPVAKSVSSLDELISAEPDVVVDFTVAQAALESLPKLCAAGIHCVVGATGFDNSDLAEIGELFNAPETPNALIAPNFAISAVLMMRFAQLAAPYFDSAEIIELHHNKKIDAPSGTAVATAQMMAEASDDWTSDPTEVEKYEGSRGGVGPGGIHIHSLRMNGLLAHQEVILGAAGQALTIRQDSFDRSSFMPGVLLACKKIASVPGFTYGLEGFLDL